jgi:hypothetical protein
MPPVSQDRAYFVNIFQLGILRTILINFIHTGHDCILGNINTLHSLQRNAQNTPRKLKV